MVSAGPGIRKAQDRFDSVKRESEVGLYPLPWNRVASHLRDDLITQSAHLQVPLVFGEDISHVKP